MSLRAHVLRDAIHDVGDAAEIVPRNDEEDIHLPVERGCGARERYACSCSRGGRRSRAGVRFRSASGVSRKTEAPAALGEGRGKYGFACVVAPQQMVQLASRKGSGEGPPVDLSRTSEAPHTDGPRRGRKAA